MKNRKILTTVIVSFIVCLIIGLITFDTFADETKETTQNKPATATMAKPKKTTDWKEVEKIIGKAGEIKPGNVYYISLPRTDLQVTKEGIVLNPAFALGSWLAFKDMDHDTMIMGDLVLKEEEINPVMSELIQGGIEITALHNHLLGDSPNTMFMHIEGHGDPLQLAKSLRLGLEKSSTPITPKQVQSTQEFTLDKKQLDQIFGKEGTISSGIYKTSFPRAEDITEDGMTIPPSMGTAIAINFQPTGNGKAAITGDFVLTAEEVNPVIRTLRKNHIEIEALHNHMLTEKPRLFFVHFWANDDAIKLAKGLKEAVGQTNYKK